MKTGIELIAEERDRQVKKGYDAEHDEDESAMQLSCAAAMFIAEATNKNWKDHTHYDDLGNCARFQLRQMDTRKWKEQWPWSDHDGRSNSDEKTCLIKAGALIAAEIDRLQNI
jgi:hypothetical protein